MKVEQLFIKCPKMGFKLTTTSIMSFWLKSLDQGSCYDRGPLLFEGLFCKSQF